MRSTALLAVRARGFKNQLAARRGATIGRSAIAAFLALAWCLAIAGGTGVALTGAFGAAASAPSQRALETIAIALAASGVIVLGLLVDNGTAASLLTTDVDRLLVAPVAHRAIVRAKIVANLPLSLLVPVPGMIAIAAVVGDASGRWAPALFVALVACAAAGVLTACAATVVATLCARVLPRRRAVLALESGAWLTASVFGLVLLWGGGASGFDRLLALARSGSDLGWGTRLVLWLPGGWVARAFAAVLHDDPGGTARATGLLAIAAAGAFLLAQECGTGLYRGGWSQREAAVRTTRARAAAPPRWARGGVGAFARKDWLLARRTPAMVLGLVGFAGYFVITAFILHGMHTIMPRFAALWVGYDIGTRALAVDRQAFWRVRAAPVGGRTIAIAKLLTVLAVAMPFSALGGAAFAAIRGAAPADALVVATDCAIVSAMGSALGLLVAAYFTNFSWTRRGTMLRSPGTWLFLPAFTLPFLVGGLLGMLRVHSRAASIAAGLGVAALCVAVVLPIVARRIDRIEWNRSE